MKTINQIFDDVKPGKPVVTTAAALTEVRLSSLMPGIKLHIQRPADVLEIERIEPWLRVRVFTEYSIPGASISESVTNINQLAVAQAWEQHSAYCPNGDEYSFHPEPIAAFWVDDNSDINAVVQKADYAIQVILDTARELLTKAASSLNLRAPELVESQQKAA